MHDLTFANEIISVLQKKLSAMGKSSLSKRAVINVRLSPLTHVTPDGLNEIFKQIAESRGLGSAVLSIKPLEFGMRCNACGFVSSHSAPVFECPKCGGSDFDIKKEKEFVIDSIDI